MLESTCYLFQGVVIIPTLKIHINVHQMLNPPPQKWVSVKPFFVGFAIPKPVGIWAMKKPGWLGYNAIHLCRDYFINHDKDP